MRGYKTRITIWRVREGEERERQNCETTRKIRFLNVSKGTRVKSRATVLCYLHVRRLLFTGHTATGAAGGAADRIEHARTTDVGNGVTDAPRVKLSSNARRATPPGYSESVGGEPEGTQKRVAIKRVVKTRRKTRR